MNKIISCSTYLTQFFYTHSSVIFTGIPEVVSLSRGKPTYPFKKKKLPHNYPNMW